MQKRLLKSKNEKTLLKSKKTAQKQKYFLKAKMHKD